MKLKKKLENLRHIGEAWFKKHGTFEVTITGNGGLVLVHKGFRRKHQIPENLRDRISRDPKDINKFRTFFENLFVAYLQADLKCCKVFYIDEQGFELGSSIPFFKWISENNSPQKVLVKQFPAYVEVTLKPPQNHMIPRGTVIVSLRFDMLDIGNKKDKKYIIDCDVKEDKRPLSKHRKNNRHRQHKRAASM
jgi:hypothetical protein